MNEFETAACVLSVAVGVALFIYLFVWLNNSLLLTTRYSLSVNGLEGNLKAVIVSDLHGKSFGRKNSRLIARIMREKPDFIAITGDIIHKYTERNKKVAYGLVCALADIAPVLYVSGNHEMRNKGYRFFRKALMDAGAVVLDDEVTEICGLKIAGLNCASLKNDTVFRLERGEGPSLLLAHMPQFIDKYAEAGYDLVFCGHAHGGQWRLPFSSKGFYSPGQGLFPKLTSGVHVRGRTRMVISRGLGNSQCPLRLFNPPEIVVAELKKEG